MQKSNLSVFTMLRVSIGAGVSVAAVVLLCVVIGTSLDQHLHTTPAFSFYAAITAPVFAVLIALLLRKSLLSRRG